MNRVALFGGSFDPVHNGHLFVALAAMEELSLERIFFVPAAQSPFKPETKPAPPELRLRMLRLALAGQTRYEVDAQEIRRGGTSYTLDTVRDYRRRFPKAELFYLIGADHIPQLHKWRAADELATTLEFVAIPRPGEGAPAPAPPPGFRVRTLRGFPLALSSSQIRERVRTGKTIDALVPAAVVETIRNSRLYL
jgi:nicotinate-nucleotide adenylyltransferase